MHGAHTARSPHTCTHFPVGAHTHILARTLQYTHAWCPHCLVPTHLHALSSTCMRGAHTAWSPHTCTHSPVHACVVPTLLGPHTLARTLQYTHAWCPHCLVTCTRSPVHACMVSTSPHNVAWCLHAGGGNPVPAICKKYDGRSQRKRRATKTNTISIKRRSRYV